MLKCGSPEVVGATVELVVAAEALVGERLTTLAALQTVSVPLKIVDTQNHAVLDRTTTTSTQHRTNGPYRQRKPLVPYSSSSRFFTAATSWRTLYGA